MFMEIEDLQLVFVNLHRKQDKYCIPFVMLQSPQNLRDNKYAV